MEKSVTLINSDLLRCVNELLNGAKIEKVNTKDEYARCVELQTQARQCNIDLKKEHERVCGPLNKTWKAAVAEFTAKEEPLEAMIKNLGNAAGAWQMEQKRIADEKEETKRKRLADIENQRLVDEQKLRDDAKAKLDQAETETDPTKKAELIEKANESTEVADLALKEATDAAQKQIEVKKERVYAPNGFKAKFLYSATVNDFRKAMTWIVKNNEWGFLPDGKFKDCVQSACNAIAKNKEDGFAVDGAILNKVPDGKGRI